MVLWVTSEWTPIISGVPQGSVLGPLLFILYTSEMFELVENRLYAYADDSTLLAVVRKPADRSAVAASVTGTWLGFRSGAVMSFLPFYSNDQVEWSTKTRVKTNVTRINKIPILKLTLSQMISL